MRIDSVGIYNNRGLIQNKSNQGIANVNKPNAKNIKPETLQSTGRLQSAKLLSAAESAQIKQLFGKFNLSELSQTGNTKDIENRPGQFIDIVI